MWQPRRVAIRTGRRGIGGGLKGVEEEGMPTVTPKHQRTINNQRIDGSRVSLLSLTKTGSKENGAVNDN